MKKEDYIIIALGAIKSTKNDHPNIFRKNISLSSLAKRIGGLLYARIELKS